MAGRERRPREPAGQMRESGGSSTGHNRETTGRANDYPFTKGRSPAPPPLTDHTKGRSPAPPPLPTHTKRPAPAPPPPPEDHSAPTPGHTPQPPRTAAGPAAPAAPT